jgi:hypothetical protein
VIFVAYPIGFLPNFGIFLALVLAFVDSSCEGIVEFLRLFV